MRSSIPTPVRLKDSRRLDEPPRPADPLTHRCQLPLRPSDPILARTGFVSGPSDCSGSMERQAKTRAPLRAQRPKEFLVSRLPPRHQQYQRRRTSSYKDFWLIVAFQGAKMSIRFGQGLSSDHVRPSRRRAFAITTSFLMIAVRATFPDFPARMS